MSSKTVVLKKCERCKKSFYGVTKKKYCGSIKAKEGCAYFVNLSSSRNCSAMLAQERMHFTREESETIKTKPRMKRTHWRSEACGSGYF